MLLVIQSPELSQLIKQPLIAFKLPRCSPLIKTSNSPFGDEERKWRGTDCVIYHVCIKQEEGERFEQLKLIRLKMMLEKHFQMCLENNTGSFG